MDTPTARDSLLSGNSNRSFSDFSNDTSSSGNFGSGNVPYSISLQTYKKVFPYALFITISGVAMVIVASLAYDDELSPLLLFIGSICVPSSVVILSLARIAIFPTINLPSSLSVTTSAFVLEPNQVRNTRLLILLLCVYSVLSTVSDGLMGGSPMSWCSACVSTSIYFSLISRVVAIAAYSVGSGPHWGACMVCFTLSLGYFFMLLELVDNTQMNPIKLQVLGFVTFGWLWRVLARYLMCDPLDAKTRRLFLCSAIGVLLRSLADALFILSLWCPLFVNLTPSDVVRKVVTGLGIALHWASTILVVSPVLCPLLARRQALFLMAPTSARK